MIDDSFWPLVGVILGWLLTTVVASWGAWEADRRRVGRALAYLFRAYEELLRLSATASRLKATTDGWEDYERIRKHLTSKHFLEPASDLDALKTSIDELAAVHPMKSLDVRGLLEILVKAKQHSFSASSKVPDVYVRLLSVHEVGLKLAQGRLRSAICWLALRHSLVTYFQVRLALRRGEQVRGQNDATLDKFASDVTAVARAAFDAGRN